MKQYRLYYWDTFSKSYEQSIVFDSLSGYYSNISSFFDAIIARCKDLPGLYRANKGNKYRIYTLDETFWKPLTLDFQLQDFYSLVKKSSIHIGI
jgi:hypothetical protein